MAVDDFRRRRRGGTLAAVVSVPAAEALWATAAALTSNVPLASACLMAGVREEEEASPSAADAVETGKRKPADARAAEADAVDAERRVAPRHDAAEPERPWAAGTRSGDPVRWGSPDRVSHPAQARGTGAGGPATPCCAGRRGGDNVGMWQPLLPQLSPQRDGGVGGVDC